MNLRYQKKYNIYLDYQSYEPWRESAPVSGYPPAKRDPFDQTQAYTSSTADVSNNRPEKIFHASRGGIY